MPSGVPTPLTELINLIGAGHFDEHLRIVVLLLEDLRQINAILHSGSSQDHHLGMSRDDFFRDRRIIRRLRRPDDLLP